MPKLRFAKNGKLALFVSHIRMNGIDFKNRFVESLAIVPDELDLNLDEFISFNSNDIQNSGLDDKDKEFLLEAGFPRDAAPFLSFEPYSENDIKQMKEDFGIESSCFPIGHNGSGDPVVIDTKTGDVLYFNHDDYMRKVFINSSLVKFAECLCIYQEHMTSETMAACLEDITNVDNRATEKDTMWYTEVQMELDNG